MIFIVAGVITADATQLFFPSNDNYNSRFALDRSNVNDNYFFRSAGQLILPGRSAARYGSHAG